LDISQKHISIDISLKCRIIHLSEIENRLFIIAVPIIADPYEEFIERSVSGIEVSELEEIILGSFPVVSQEIRVGKHLIRKDIILILKHCMECKSLGENEVSIFK